MAKVAFFAFVIGIMGLSAASAAMSAADVMTAHHTQLIAMDD